MGSLSPALVAHGRRGHDRQPEAEREAWFITDPLRVAAVPSEISFPYYSGDVVWVGGDDSISMPITVEDTNGLVALLAGQRSETPSRFEERLAGGEQPLSNSTAAGLDPIFAPGDIDQWGYRNFRVLHNTK